MGTLVTPRRIDLIGQCFRMGIFQEYIYSGNKMMVLSLFSPAGQGCWGGGTYCAPARRDLGKAPPRWAEEELGKSDSALVRWGWFVFVFTGFLVCTGCGAGEGAELCLDGPHPAADAAQLPHSLGVDKHAVCLIGGGGIHQCLKCDPAGCSLCKYML